MDWVTALLHGAQTGGIEGAIEVAKSILTYLFDTFILNFPNLLDMGLNLLNTILNGITNALPNVGKTMLTILKAIVDKIVEHGPQLLTSGLNLVIQLAAGLIQALPDLLETAWKLIKGILEAFGEADWASIGSNIVSGIWAGFEALYQWLIDNISKSVESLWAWVKKMLGIASPSKKFAYIGEMSALGMAEGFKEGEDEMQKSVAHTTAAMVEAATGVTGAGEGMERSVSYNLAATTGGTTIIVPLSINGREVARATAWSMGEQLAWEEM